MYTPFHDTGHEKFPANDSLRLFFVAARRAVLRLPRDPRALPPLRAWRLF